MRDATGNKGREKGDLEGNAVASRDYVENCLCWCIHEKVGKHGCFEKDKLDFVLSYVKALLFGCQVVSSIGASLNTQQEFPKQSLLTA